MDHQLLASGFRFTVAKVRLPEQSQADLLLSIAGSLCHSNTANTQQTLSNRDASARVGKSKHSRVTK